ncbi:MAG TPA: DUF983 domain-containing protein [Stellaceae bacterium]|nr:DUF983 domain-containing protein [Stellaceae bacterium]
MTGPTDRWDDGASASILTAALRCRCPRCGKGPLYSGLLDVRPSCSVCGLDLSANDAGDGASAFVILILGAIVIGLAFWVEVTFSPPLWLHIVLWGPTILVGSIVLLRWVKAGLIAQQYRVRGMDKGVDP